MFEELLITKVPSRFSGFIFILYFIFYFAQIEITITINFNSLNKSSICRWLCRDETVKNRPIIYWVVTWIETKIIVLKNTLTQVHII